jgi:hypothetical protein
MKTAMQELIDLMKSHEARGWGNMTFDFFYAQLDEMKALEKEKQQILDARLDGFVISGEGWNGEYPFEGKTYEEISLKINNEEYYKITYE